MYQNTFAVCLAKLGLFCAVALVVGLVIRIPFIGLNHFFEERMEDTKMM
jgi:putative membrane protein